MMCERCEKSGDLFLLVTKNGKIVQLPSFLFYQEIGIESLIGSL